MEHITYTSDHIDDITNGKFPMIDYRWDTFIKAEYPKKLFVEEAKSDVSLFIRAQYEHLDPEVINRGLFDRMMKVIGVMAPHKRMIMNLDYYRRFIEARRGNYLDILIEDNDPAVRAMAYAISVLHLAPECRSASAKVLKKLSSENEQGAGIASKFNKLEDLCLWAYFNAYCNDPIIPPEMIIREHNREDCLHICREIAKAGYWHDLLYRHPDESIRKAVAQCGSHIDILLSDPSESVRFAAAMSVALNLCEGKPAAHDRAYTVRKIETFEDLVANHKNPIFIVEPSYTDNKVLTHGFWATNGSFYKDPDRLWFHEGYTDHHSFQVNANNMKYQKFFTGIPEDFDGAISGEENFYRILHEMHGEANGKLKVILCKDGHVVSDSCVDEYIDKALSKFAFGFPADCVVKVGTSRMMAAMIVKTAFYNGCHGDVEFVCQSDVDNYGNAKEVTIRNVGGLKSIDVITAMIDCIKDTISP